MSELLEVKEQFLERGRFIVHDGNHTRFLEDVWVGIEPLMKVYPSLYNIVREKNDIVAKVLSTSPLNIYF